MGERPLSRIGSCYFAIAAKVWIPHIATSYCDGRVGQYGLEAAVGLRLLERPDLAGRK